MGRKTVVRVVIFAVVVGLAVYLVHARAKNAAQRDAQQSDPTLYAKTPQTPTDPAKRAPTAVKKAPSPEKAAPTHSIGDKHYADGLKAGKAGASARIRYFERAIEEDPRSDGAKRAALELGEYYLSKGLSSQARNALSLALQGDLSSEQASRTKRKLAALNEELIFSRRSSPDAAMYEVKPGDSLASIARKHDTTWELVKRINGIKDENVIRVGEPLKVPRGPFDVVVDKSELTLTVYLRGNFVKEYKVGIGKNGCTPEGEFHVENKLTKPVWIHEGKHYSYGDPGNPLGTHWIGFSGQYGIHGTKERDSIGKEASKGCIRMLNEDVEELFSLLICKKSEVTIVK